MVFASCKKDGDLITASSTPTAGALTASATTISLSKATLTGNAVTFTSTNANFGYNAAVTSTLQIAVKGTNFSAPKEVALTGKNVSQSYNVQDFNNILLGLNMPTGVAGQIEARMKYTISTNATAPLAYSNVLTLTATPFALTSYVYVPGAYQGWNPSTADSLKSATGNGVYTGIINFTAGNLEFKITPVKKWDVSYGDAGSGKVSTSSGGNLKAPGTGLYLITLDLNANTITMVPAPAYYSIIGDATAGGWGSDTDMKYDNGNEWWTVTTNLTAGGAFKVRKNHDWGTSYGLIATPDGASLTSANGGNIAITATGTYKITFAVNATDATKATYTLTKQ